MFEETEKLKSFLDETVKNVTQLVKKSSELTIKKSDILYLNTFPEYNNNVNDINNIIQSNIRNLAKCAGCSPKWPSKMTSSDFQKSECDKDLMETLIDVNDYLLELVECNLNEALGIKQPQANNCEQLLEKYNLNKNTTNPNIENCKNILKNDLCPSKPQLLWSNILLNDNNPFIPSLDTKPNALIPLDTDLEKFTQICNDENIVQLFKNHPYSYEIYKLEYNMNIYKNNYHRKIRKPREFEHDYHYIDTLEQLDDFMTFIESSNIKEIGVDLEAHSLRSYLGFVCLMQISTRKEDFIIDTIALHDHITILNKIFTDPNILKIFHGADSDIKWLQRDFNIYVVNLFDTYVGSKKLPFPRRNLAYLLKHYCNVDTDKSFQRADWRIRPLTNDMIKYARIDTHYLHYIYDRMIVDLLECDQNKGQTLLNVFSDCKTVSLNVYEKPPSSDISIIRFKEKFARNMSISKIRCLEELFHWRYSIAQKYDESPEYVLPQHMLLELANRLPKDKEGVIAYCTPLPPLLNENITTICKIIKSCLESESIVNKLQPNNEICTLKPQTKGSLTDYLKIEVVGFKSVFKIPSEYISQEYKYTQAVPIKYMECDTPKILSIKRNVYPKKEVRDLQNSFVDFFTLYRKAIIENKVDGRYNTIPIDIAYISPSDRATKTLLKKIS